MPRQCAGTLQHAVPQQTGRSPQPPQMFVCLAAQTGWQLRTNLCNTQVMLPINTVCTCQCTAFANSALHACSWPGRQPGPATWQKHWPLGTPDGA